MIKKLLVLGLDGATLSLLNREQLPNIKKLIDTGISGELVSRPPVTPIAWTSIVTGVNPGKHGIFGFRKGDQLIDSTAKKTKELWDYLPSIAVNIPMTYPAQKIDGIMITGMMTPDLDSEGIVYPQIERDYLKKIGYVIEPEIDLEAIKQSIKTRIKLTEHYLENKNFALFFHVFREFDPLQHFFWGQDLSAYQLVDQFVGKLVKKYPQMYLMFVSDHGFTRVDKTFNLDRWLRENFKNKAFAGGWGAVYLKPEINPPTGGQKLKIRDKIINQLGKLEYQGKRVTDVWSREELYWGPYAYQGPDIIVSPKRNNGFTFGVGDSKIIDVSKKKNGCHLENAVFILNGPGIRSAKVFGTLYDVFPTIMQVLGRGILEGLDGKSLL